jgi:hypothetical protein
MVGQRVSFDVADLGGKELLVQIEWAKPGEVEGFLNGRKAKTRVVSVKLVGYERPLGCKPTLCKSITDLAGTGEIEKWAGLWMKLYTELVPDPSRGQGARCEAVRIRPDKPTKAELDHALASRGNVKSPPATAPARDDAADQRLVGKVCADIECATTEEQVEAAIAPHRDEIKQMDKRLQSIVLSAKKVALDAIKNPAPPAQEGKPDAQ